VNGPADTIADAGDGAERVGPRPKMGDRAQELERVSLLLQGIRFGIGPAVHGDAFRENFGRLPLSGRLPHVADDGDTGPGRQLFDLRLIVRQSAFGDDLDVAEARAVVELEEAEATLRIAASANPALELHVLADHHFLARLGDADLFHDCLLLASLRSRQYS